MAILDISFAGDSANDGKDVRAAYTTNLSECSDVINNVELVFLMNPLIDVIDMAKEKYPEYSEDELSEKYITVCADALGEAAQWVHHNYNTFIEVLDTDQTAVYQVPGRPYGRISFATLVDKAKENIIQAEEGFADEKVIAHLKDSRLISIMISVEDEDEG